jgi:hypothetical protein
MKKIIYREIFWLILTIVLSLFVSFVFMEFFELSSTDKNLKSIEKIFSVQLYIIGCIVSFICIYIIRVIVTTIKILIN